MLAGQCVFSWGPSDRKQTHVRAGTRGSLHPPSDATTAEAGWAPQLRQATQQHTQGLGGMTGGSSDGEKTLVLPPPEKKKKKNLCWLTDSVHEHLLVTGLSAC